MPESESVTLLLGGVIAHPFGTTSTLKARIARALPCSAILFAVQETFLHPVTASAHHLNSFVIAELNHEKANPRIRGLWL